MEKVNWGRIILGGIAGGVVMHLLMFFFHGVLLKENYEFLGSMGIVLKEPRMMGLHIAAQVLSGIPLAMLYVACRKFGGPGPMTAIRTGVLVSLVTLGGATAMYCFYNLGGKVPAITFVGNLVGMTAATLVAGVLYKD